MYSSLKSCEYIYDHTLNSIRYIAYHHFLKFFFFSGFCLLPSFGSYSCVSFCLMPLFVTIRLDQTISGLKSSGLP